MAMPISSGEARAAFAPLSSFHRLALAVSGGADSMALLHLVAHSRAEDALTREVTVLTVDHGLRASSREEAAMVVRMAASLGLNSCSPHLDTRRTTKRRFARAGTTRTLRSHGGLLPG